MCGVYLCHALGETYFYLMQMCVYVGVAAAGVVLTCPFGMGAAHGHGHTGRLAQLPARVPPVCVYWFCGWTPLGRSCVCSVVVCFYSRSHAARNKYKYERDRNRARETVRLATIDKARWMGWKCRRFFMANGRRMRVFRSIACMQFVSW